MKKSEVQILQRTLDFLLYIMYNLSHNGKVVEWLKALVLKTSEVKASVGSNPTLSVALYEQMPP